MFADSPHLPTPDPGFCLPNVMPKLFHGACYYPELWPEADLDRDIAGLQGGEVKLPHAATDAISGAKLDAGPLKLGRYEWRALTL